MQTGSFRTVTPGQTSLCLAMRKFTYERVFVIYRLQGVVITSAANWRYTRKVKRLFQTIDDSGDGAINFQEFSKLVQSPKLKFWMAQLEAETHLDAFVFAHSVRSGGLHPQVPKQPTIPDFKVLAVIVFHFVVEFAHSFMLMVQSCCRCSLQHWLHMFLQRPSLTVRGENAPPQASDSNRAKLHMLPNG